MSDQQAADWYPDPRTPGHLRYWDGSAWTEHTAPDPEVMEAPPARRFGKALILASPAIWLLATLLPATVHVLGSSFNCGPALLVIPAYSGFEDATTADLCRSAAVGRVLYAVVGAGILAVVGAVLVYSNPKRLPDR